MKKISLLTTIVIAAIACIFFQCYSEGGTPWTSEQLMSPYALNKYMHSDQAAKVHVFNIGPAGLITGAVNIGDGKEPASIQKLRTELEKIDKNEKVVIYCGCCPYKNCPNIRPAFSLLKEMKFNHPFLLDLPTNLKVDWIDKGYAVEK